MAANLPLLAKSQSRLTTDLRYRSPFGNRGTDEKYPMLGSPLPFTIGLLFVCPLSSVPHSLSATALMALLASALPALRAASADPIDALRSS
jgi:ABC-type antimicrobial peptide transport system permease subunit